MVILTFQLPEANIFSIIIVMKDDKFERWVEEAIQALPWVFRKKLKNIEITIKDHPPLDLQKRFPDKFLFLGVYQGIPLTQRRVYHTGSFPDRITIFRDPIERVCSSESQMRRLVHETVLHEIGHYFGLNEEDLRCLNLKLTKKEK